MILVVGATGSTGSEPVHLLSAGGAVHACDQLARARAPAFMERVARV